ncbi:hypothetical protein [Veronia pacifica]|uniref:Uncharacterized protein n=1 Tax=Veronia pacifica TaxID=1080227 RepID=A0A1C3EC47_9GAMM|nr:hypothetical protein [Veronia pacifica]ODA30798.1 hypothetical protein A8L45_19300 [Veronia pacifica]
MNIEKIADIICQTARDEDIELSELANEGIFWMPELAFVYQCGKNIIREAESVFGTSEVIWCREKNYGNGGPTDLAFELPNGELLAIEFKLRATTTAYEGDVKKLCRISRPQTTRLFCALVDVFESVITGDDGRQKHIETLPGYRVTPIKKLSFSTKQNWYKSPVKCVACVWSVELESETR